VQDNGKQWTDAFGSPVECIQRFGRLVVGLNDPNKRGANRLDLVRQLTKGTKLVLIPDSDSSADRNAMLVFRADDRENDLGYLDDTGAEIVSRMMKCGATFSAELESIWDEDPRFPHVSILVYQLTPMLPARDSIRADGRADHAEPSKLANGEKVPDMPSSNLWSFLRF
jgi:hypothetical protein